MSEDVGRNIPVRISNSTFNNVDVMWAGGYGTMSDASVEGDALTSDYHAAKPLGFGAVVLDLARSGVSAAIEVIDTTFSGVTGGLGHAITVRTHARISSTSITLTDVTLEGCMASLYSGYAVYVEGALASFTAMNMRFTGSLDGLLAVTRTVDVVGFTDCQLTGNTAEYEPTLLHLGGLGVALSFQGCSVLDNEASDDWPTIVIDTDRLFAMRQRTVEVSRIAVMNSTIARVSGGFLSSDVAVNELLLRDSVIADNSGGVFQLGRTPSGVGSVKIEGCRIQGNTADYSGGFLNAAFLGTLTLNNSVVQGNVAQNNGGCVNVGSQAWNAVVQISNSTVGNNTAAMNGGVLAVMSGVSLTVDGASKVEFNAALTGSGGVVHVGGASESAVLVAIASRVTGNTAARQGGVLAASDLVSCVVDGEVSGNSARQGAAFHVAGGLQSLRVTGGGVFRDNTPTTQLGGSIWVGEELGSLALEAGSSVSGSLGSLEGVAELTEVAAAGASAEARVCVSVQMCCSRPPAPPSPPPVYGAYGAGQPPPVYGGPRLRR
ncbi:hypothetical protein HYH03_012967 [Edaphochlamys debaryana]|uniref:Uncharacterized protein n=1 Tax=Edaphochlamys debaryana TaxID=47281 RepID=A0A835XQX4_9CHLO|nr:hypothetical protein HYH03_012967 [Edaphochlamys debaryana]|eukprot:KAG2488461.1 hypothetical protein HYH03_012967 [Edaphochlamys debaryana]